MCVHDAGGTRHDIHTEVRRQLCGVDFPVSGVEVRLSLLRSKHLYPLNHPACPVPGSEQILQSHGKQQLEGPLSGVMIWQVRGEA